MYLTYLIIKLSIGLCRIELLCHECVEGFKRVDLKLKCFVYIVYETDTHLGILIVDAERVDGMRVSFAPLRLHVIGEA